MYGTYPFHSWYECEYSKQGELVYLIMICMVLNTILYMDGDVKNKTIEQLLLSLHTKTSVSVGISSPSSPSALFVSCM